MSFTITDKELEQIIQDASLSAAKQAAENAAKNAVATLMAKLENRQVLQKPIITKVDDVEDRQIMETMQPLLQDEHS